MLAGVLVLLIIALLFSLPTQLDTLRTSPEKSRKIVSIVVLFCLGFAIGVIGYILISGGS